MVATTALGHNLAFLVVASLIVWITARRSAGTARFPGPRPVGQVFKAWLVVIWVVGFLLPLATLVRDGVLGGRAALVTALGAYFLLFFAQIATEIACWKAGRTPAWVVVPCLYLPWRLWQVAWGAGVTATDATPLTQATWIALFVLWVINVGVHYTGIPLTLRWDHHPRDATFPALGDRPPRS
jgi:hypothetical protein